MNSSYLALCCDTVINITPNQTLHHILLLCIVADMGYDFSFHRKESGYRRYTNLVLRQDVDAHLFVGAKHIFLGGNIFLTEKSKLMFCCWILISFRRRQLRPAGEKNGSLITMVVSR
jgi:hypothetical protein